MPQLVVESRVALRRAVWLSQTRRKETVWLTPDQYEVLEIVTRALDQSISKWLTESILSMLECDLEYVEWELKKKLDRPAEVQGTGRAIAK
jgi:hypothetical protein